MIIQIIDICRVTALEPKCHPPITRDRDSKMTFPAAFERELLKAGQVHSFGPATAVQGGQDTPEFRDVARRDFRCATTLI